MSALERRVVFAPGFDCIRFKCAGGEATCFPGSGGSHGVHGVEISWLVIGERGAVEFLLYTNWLPEPERFGLVQKPGGPMPAALNYHARGPEDVGDEPTRDECPFIGAPCYKGGSALASHEPFRVLCNEGDGGLWAYLEQVYRARYEGAEYPTSKPYMHEPRAARARAN